MTLPYSFRTSILFSSTIGSVPILDSESIFTIMLVLSNTATHRFQPMQALLSK